MVSQKQKAQGLPSPHPSVGLPNPYALGTAVEAVPANPAEDQAKPEEKKQTAHRFHNPHTIKRPQAKANPTVKKPVAPKSNAMPVSSTTAVTASTPSSKRDLSYYVSTIDDDAATLEAKRDKERFERLKKKEQKHFNNKYGIWKPNDNYRLKDATNIRAYQATGEYQFAVENFNDHLREARTNSFDDHSSPQRSVSPPLSRSRSNSSSYRPNPMFRPPPNIEHTRPPTPPSIPESNASPTKAAEPTTSVTPPVSSKASDVQAGKAAAIQQAILLAKKIAASAAPAQPPPPPPPPTVSSPVKEDIASPPPPPPPPPPETSAPAYNPTISAPPVRYNPTISAAPVHYARPEPEQKDNEPPAKKQRTKAPPKQSKAALMMAKMGYVKGQGLGKNSDGVTTHLEVKIRKDQYANRQVRDEFEDGEGKVIKSQQVFDIVGGHRKQGESNTKNHGPFGEPSRVIVTWGCVDGVDFALDAERDDGGIRQVMGDTFNAKFGPVERIHVNLADSDSTSVYIQFTDPLCALNAVNRFHEGFLFQDRRIRAEFYDEPKFNNFVYDY